jgi:hypothetical protein
MIATLFLFFIQGIAGQHEKRSVLLPADQAKVVSGQYSRDRSEKINGSWSPTEANLDTLDANISQISNMKIYGWDSRIHIDHPEQYFRQYIAVLVDDKEKIFVNAFCDKEPPSNWHDRLFLVIDGATCYWQVLYDPATKQFSNLRINARA